MLDLVSLRRDFHMHPEVGFTEFRTASKVVEILASLGFDVIYGADAMEGDSRRGLPSADVLEAAYERALRDGANPQIVEKMRGGYTAVIGVKKGKQEGPAVAFRFDMDALPVLESTDADHIPQAKAFRSRYEGNMHACAHDGHTTIGLGLAEKLADGNFSGTVKLIFQPAEEGVRGAYSIVQKGMLDDVDYIFCHHLGTNVPLGEVHGASFGFLATTKMVAHFHGVPSHAGASPEKGKNALLGAATALLNIHAIPRFSTGSTRVNVGVLEGGTAANIIPQHAKMIVETRSVSEEVNAELEQRVRNIIAHSAAMHELEHEIEVIGGAIPINSDLDMAELAIEEAKQVEGFTAFKVSDSNAMGSEDASFMIKRVQERGGKGTYMAIGTDIPAPHHHPKFDIQEEILPRSVELLHRIAKRLLT
ncbi:amidohydrolase [Brevibacillus borstelensis]|uniref:amidohydrolase n=1 Tax=Brevibacillus borstelensis TaxID=45462 RepID=UPI0004F2A0E8|nr:amidohydrolase [Brevibacillus borstelensis]KKX54280.1 aminobenzoyl-glutamate utilization protein A [Brevibacillus borstelensis cifa_chp40]MED2008326.1 amidohydrolase [Brevibacillus borstelensis]